MKPAFTAFGLLLCLSAAAETRLYGTVSSAWEISRSHGPERQQRDTRIRDRDSHIGLRGSFSFDNGSRLIGQTAHSTPAAPASFQEYVCATTAAAPQRPVNFRTVAVLRCWKPVAR